MVVSDYLLDYFIAFLEGKGKEFWPDGSIYEGGGKKEGTGVFRWKEGAVYEGKNTINYFKNSLG